MALSAAGTFRIGGITGVAGDLKTIVPLTSVQVTDTDTGSVTMQLSAQQPLPMPGQPQSVRFEITLPLATAAEQYKSGGLYPISITVGDKIAE